jgi:hypothetical protein
MHQFSQLRRRVRHDNVVTPQTNAYVGHMPLPSDPALITALIRDSTGALTLLRRGRRRDLDASARRDQN